MKSSHYDPEATLLSIVAGPHSPATKEGPPLKNNGYKALAQSWPKGVPPLTHALIPSEGFHISLTLSLFSGARHPSTLSSAAVLGQIRGRFPGARFCLPYPMQAELLSQDSDMWFC